MRGNRGRNGPDPAWRGIVADIRRAGTPRGRRTVGCFVIEGTRLHERALRASAPIVSVVVRPELRDRPDPRERAVLDGLHRAGVPVAVAPSAVLAELTGGRSIGAMVGLVRTPEPQGLAGILARSTGGKPRLLAAIDVEDPGNVGALVRTALASGAVAFAAVGISDPYHPRAVRTSMGSVLKLPIVTYATATPLLAELDRRDFEKVATVSSGGTPLPRIALGSGGVAVLVGSEAFGLPPDLVDAADHRVTVPMVEGVDSFSVNAVAAVVLYEIAWRAAAAGPDDRCRR